jgi:hypothetical protein
VRPSPEKDTFGYRRHRAASVWGARPRRTPRGDLERDRSLFRRSQPFQCDRDDRPREAICRHRRVADGYVEHIFPRECESWMNAQTSPSLGPRGISGNRERRSGAFRRGRDAPLPITRSEALRRRKGGSCKSGTGRSASVQNRKPTVVWTNWPLAFLPSRSVSGGLTVGRFVDWPSIVGPQI